MDIHQDPHNTADTSSAGGAAPSPSPQANCGNRNRLPLVILVVGMAGTGKTTLVHRLQNYSDQKGIRSYFLNLDPALLVDPPYDVNMDIRDTVNYRELLQQYRLGPNGGIMTALNLYATKFHEVIHILEQKTSKQSTAEKLSDNEEPHDEGLDWIVVDTPGQIEVFTWSASGQLITEAFASTFPTVVLFVADTTRCVNPQTFMSTMLYSSSIMFKSQLPLLVVFNKSDVTDCQFALQWMRDHEALADAARGNKNYSATLTQSLSLFVQEFYATMVTVGVSAVTGAGMDTLRAGLETARHQYETEFLPMILEKQAKKETEDKARQAKQVKALQGDHRGTSLSNPASR